MRYNKKNSKEAITMEMKYKRILLKLSGEAISGGSEGIYNYEMIDKICAAIAKARGVGAEIGIVIGAGNIWRGRSGGSMDRPRADAMGMLATVMNSFALQDGFERMGVPAVVLTAVDMPTFGETFTKQNAIHHLTKGRICIFAGGTGRPFFSTDTAAVLRAAEIDADVCLFAKNIDGIYTADPKTDPTATKYDEITFAEILQKNLRAIDLTAAAFCIDAKMNVLAFSLEDPENILRALRGENVGTVIHN